MGFCLNGDEQYDAFLSYAHADNIANNRWIADFHKYMQEVVVAELARADCVTSDEAGRFKICRDETGFPDSGDLQDTITDYVLRSRFLFIFLGKGYLKSPYCLSELEVFKQTVGGETKAALSRAYIILLDRESLNKLKPSNDATLPENRLWAPIRNLIEKGIRKEDFLDDDRLIPVYGEDGDRATPQFHERCIRLAREFAAKLITARGSATSRRPPSEARTDRPIVVGAVPRRLETTRQELLNALDGLPVLAIERDQIRQPGETLLSQLARATAFVLPFDDGAVLIEDRDDPPGGHLAIQKDLFDRYAASVGASLVWWKPPIGLLGEAGKDRPLAAADRAFLDAQPASQMRTSTAFVLAQELIQPLAPPPGLPPPKVTAQIWIEWQETDTHKIDEAKQELHDRFQTIFDTKRSELRFNCEAEINFGEADWGLLQQELYEKPDSVVIVFNQRKSQAALREQTEKISGLPEFYMRKMLPGIFLLREGFFRPSQHWSVVRFLAQQQVKDADIAEFANNLFSVIYERHLRGQSVAEPRGI